MSSKTTTLWNLDSIPSELRETPAWVCWRLETSRKTGKMAKIPYTPGTDSMAKSDDPATWGTFAEAKNAHLTNVHNTGIGFMLAPPYVGGDCDHAVTDGLITDSLTIEILDTLQTYTEHSPSYKLNGHNSGLRWIAKGVLPPNGRKNGNYEMYDRVRFVTMTGHVVDGRDTIRECQDEINQVHARVFPKQAEKRPPAPSRPVDLDDQALLEKARNANGTGQRFCATYDRGDISGFSSHSEADLWLCGRLAFWTGNDAPRMDRLFRAGALMRDKWDSRRGDSTYGRDTIMEAIAGTTETYPGPGRKATDPLPEPTMPPHVAAAEREANACQESERNASLTASQCNVQVKSETQTGQNSAHVNLEKEAKKTRQFFRCTDMGNGMRMAVWFGHLFRWCNQRKEWLTWDGKRWVFDDLCQIEAIAKDTVRAIYKEASECQDDDMRKVIGKWAHRSESGPKRKQMRFSARSEPGIPIKQDLLDLDIWALNVENGTLDLRTGQLKPHNRADLITKLAPVKYDPNATCPTFDAFLSEIMGGDQVLISFLQRAFGCTLTGDVSERALLIAHGETGDNGKSTLFNVFNDLLGDYAMVTPPETFLKQRSSPIPNDIARLQGARFVSSTESNDGAQIAEATVKALTGNEKISARFMRSEWFDFMPQFKPWLATNHKPTIVGTDPAIWNRIKLIPFDVTIPKDKQDEHLGDKLKAELSGILNWALRGCLEWQKNGLGTPDAVKKATKAYQEENDSLSGFITDCCVEKESAKTPVKTLYPAFFNWCLDTGMTCMTKRAFTEACEERGFEKARGTGNKLTIYGLGLLVGDPLDDAMK